MFERFTDRARRVVVVAQDEARQLRHDYIGTEHLLLGLVRESQGMAAKALESLGIGPAAVRDAVRAAVSEGQDPIRSGHIPFTPEAKHVLELALREALQMGCNYIGTEHILLGVLREKDGVGAEVLTGLGADLGTARQNVAELLRTRAPRRWPGIVGRQGRGLSWPGSAAGLEDLGRRVSALELSIGIAPDLSELDAELTRLRQDKEAAIDVQDFKSAAELRDLEKELLDRRAAAERDWTPKSLADEVRELHAEVDRLRAIMRERGIDPGDAA